MTLVVASPVELAVYRVQAPHPRNHGS